jgi:hypothetical protein
LEEACVGPQKDHDENAKKYEILEFLKNDKGKLEEVFGSARRASESCWRPLRLLNRNENEAAKKFTKSASHKLSMALHRPPQVRRLSVNFSARKIDRPAKNKISAEQRLIVPATRFSSLLLAEETF